LVLLSQADVDAVDPSISSVNGNLIIGPSISNLEIIDLSSLTHIIAISGEINIAGNPLLASLDGLGNITTCNELTIISNISLVSLDGLNLDEIDVIYITGNDRLQNIDALASIQQVGFLNITNNDAIRNIDGFRNITEVGSSLIISNNSSLTDIQGINNIRDVPGTIRCTSNDLLENCCPLAELIERSNPIGININNPKAPCANQLAISNDCIFKAVLSVNNPCINESNGSLFVQVLNAEIFPLTYSWTNKEDGSIQVGETTTDNFSFENLSQGCYSLTITSASMDTIIEDNINLVSEDGEIFEIIAVETINGSNGLPNGSISFIAAGNNFPFTVEWGGTASGVITEIKIDTITIGNLEAGEYDILISNNLNSTKTISITLLDDEVPIIPCAQAMDIVILNDVSNSVDEVEYLESKEFFVDFMNEINIGAGAEESRVALVEWSSTSTTIIPMTNNINQINQYASTARSLSDRTNPFQAFQFAEAILSTELRPDAVPVIVLSSDGSLDEFPPAMVSYVDELRAKGYYIVTIAFDSAFRNMITRELLQELSTNDFLAPGASAYSLLDENLAEQIVNVFLCPIDPGDYNRAYFYRDGIINVIDIVPNGNCPQVDDVDITFVLEASLDLALPAGIPVSFYLNDPNFSAASHLFSWQLPCALGAGELDTFTVTIPVSGPGNLYAVLNDDGSVAPPIQLPVTDIEEIAYSNNIDNISFCVDRATIQAKKSTSTPNPVCGNQVIYNIDICNLSDVDANDIIVEDVAPQGFVAVGEIVITNGCGSISNGTYNIDANCCISITITYNAEDAALGTYDNQDAVISGPSNQTYIIYDGSTSDAEDVIIDGTIDCPSTNISFNKSVNRLESCDERFITYTFEIANETVVPLSGLVFTDTLPAPSFWIYEPYLIEDMQIGNFEITENVIRVDINKLQALTTGRFRLDVQLADWDSDGTLTNVAYLSNIPDFDSLDYQVLNSSAVTEIIASPELILPDTIFVDPSVGSVFLELDNDAVTEILWSTKGDGQFSDYNSSNPEYIIGVQDSIDGGVLLSVGVTIDCHEVNALVYIKIQDCSPVVIIDLDDCDNNGTNTDVNDDFVSATISVTNTSQGEQWIMANDTIELGPYNYDDNITIDIPANGEENTYTISDVDYSSCSTTITITQDPCSDGCVISLDDFVVNVCTDNGTSLYTPDDIYKISFNVSGFNVSNDSLYTLDYHNGSMDYAYNEDHTLDLPANGEEVILTFTDKNDPDCTIEHIFTAPENCSFPCLVSIEKLEQGDCYNGGTPADTSDDTYDLIFVLVGDSIGVSGDYTLSSDPTLEYTYGIEYGITLKANGEDINLIFEDKNNPSCKIDTAITNVVACSNSCLLSINTWNISQCDDNDTPDDSSDDEYALTIQVSNININLSSSYRVMIDDISYGSYNYDALVELVLTADSKEHTLLVVDEENMQCIYQEVFRLDHCSFEKGPSLYFPNVFNINSTSGNAAWEVINTSDRINMLSCSIYDRWGSIVYNSGPTDIVSWDGRLNGAKLPLGVYCYKISYVIDDMDYQDFGTITLIR